MTLNFDVASKSLEQLLGRAQFLTEMFLERFNESYQEGLKLKRCPNAVFGCSHSIVSTDSFETTHAMMILCTRLTLGSGWLMSYEVKKQKKKIIVEIEAHKVPESEESEWIPRMLMNDAEVTAFNAKLTSGKRFSVSGVPKV